MKDEHWLIKYWRPCTAWSYMIICLYDFAIGPCLYNILQYKDAGQTISLWTSITLQGSGLYHLSMGTIIGASAHGRSKEKIKILEGIQKED